MRMDDILGGGKDLVAAGWFGGLVVETVGRCSVQFFFCFPDFRNMFGRNV